MLKILEEKLKTSTDTFILDYPLCKTQEEEDSCINKYFMSLVAISIEVAIELNDQISRIPAFTEQGTGGYHVEVQNVLAAYREVYPGLTIGYTKDCQVTVEPSSRCFTNLVNKYAP